MKQLKMFSQSSNISSYHLEMIITLLWIGITALAAVKFAGDLMNQGQEFNLTVNSTPGIPEADMCENFTGIEKAKCYLEN